MHGNAFARARVYPGLPHSTYRISLAARALATRALCLFFYFFLLSDVFGTRALYFFFCYTCFNDTCPIFMFVFLMLTIPRSFYFSECEILTALPNYWAPSFLRASHGR